MLYARWTEMFVNGEAVLGGGGKGWEVRDGTKLYLTNATDYVVSGRNVLGELAIYVNAAGEVPPTSAGKPTVQLGVVAQRYPWNGWLDVQYKTPYANASVTVTFNATIGAEVIELGTAKGTGGQPATASFDLTAIDTFKDKQLKGVKITATIE